MSHGINKQVTSDFPAVSGVRTEALFGGLTYTMVELLNFVSFGGIKMEPIPGPSVITASLDNEIRFTHYYVSAGKHQLGKFDLVEVIHLRG